MQNLSEITIRHIETDELNDLLALYKDLAPSDPPLLPEKAQETFQRLQQSNEIEIWVAEKDSEIVASCVALTVPNLTRGGRPYTVIENVVTKAEHRQQGIGKKLMQHVIDKAKANDCYKIMLQTGSSNPATHGFYKSLGFRDDLKVAYNIRDTVSKVNY